MFQTEENEELNSFNQILNLKGGDCIVCYTSFTTNTNEPVFFQCGHTICKKCSEKLKENCTINYSISKKKIRCPTCFIYSPYPLIKNYELINILELNNPPKLIPITETSSRTNNGNNFGNNFGNNLGASFGNNLGNNTGTNLGNNLNEINSNSNNSNQNNNIIICQNNFNTSPECTSHNC